MTELFRLYDRVIVKRRVGDTVSDFKGEIRSKPCADILAAEYDILFEGEIQHVRIKHGDIRLDGKRCKEWARTAFRIDLMAKEEEKASPSLTRAKAQLGIIPRWLRQPWIDQERAA